MLGRRSAFISAANQRQRSGRSMSEVPLPILHMSAPTIPGKGKQTTYSADERTQKMLTAENCGAFSSSVVEQAIARVTNFFTHFLFGIVFFLLTSLIQNINVSVFTIYSYSHGTIPISLNLYLILICQIWATQCGRPLRKF